MCLFLIINHLINSQLASFHIEKWKYIYKCVYETIIVTEDQNGITFLGLQRWTEQPNKETNHNLFLFPFFFFVLGKL